jgi:hypothetical protein
MEMSGNVNNLSGDAAIAYLREQEAIRRARSKRRWIAAAITIGSMFVLMVGCGIAVGAAAPDTRSTTTPRPSAMPTTPTDGGLREETRTVPVPPVAVSAPAVAPEGPPALTSAEPPRTWIAEGMWLVGPEIEAGTYRSDGPDESGSCYIDAQVGEHYAAQEVSNGGPVRVTVADGQTVDMSGCRPFTKVG